jgi:hypothetical protein
MKIMRKGRSGQIERCKRVREKWYRMVGAIGINTYKK